MEDREVLWESAQSFFGGGWANRYALNKAAGSSSRLSLVSVLIVLSWIADSGGCGFRRAKRHTCPGPAFYFCGWASGGGKEASTGAAALLQPKCTVIVSPLMENLSTNGLEVLRLSNFIRFHLALSLKACGGPPGNPPPRLHRSNHALSPSKWTTLGRARATRARDNQLLTLLFKTGTTSPTRGNNSAAASSLHTSRKPSASSVVDLSLWIDLRDSPDEGIRRPTPTPDQDIMMKVLLGRPLSEEGSLMRCGPMEGTRRSQSSEGTCLTP
ncbi:hypothetical protein BDK51DRAFT_39017 [Blyttiomyces helicus]|uniref:Uncharacterized protein n=1 Tax=Blyttiomyces helicus TaxID=388810 RepID=A0A4P9WAL0_9FUNG|nr:hypothetical protein BDK51DRAFT_39017 [Blyttiomyces helicus]|eukprot:RKO87900.1 hypothetical protein BDK51DRAFT_39017 [Blyttiomyces helicus]